jgi:hypothetical protein
MKVTMPREDARTRGRRLVAEGRLIVSHVDPRSIAAVVRGDSGRIWRCGFDRARGWWCHCPALTKCAHIHCLQLVTLAPFFTIEKEEPPR